MIDGQGTPKTLITNYVRASGSKEEQLKAENFDLQQQIKTLEQEKNELQFRADVAKAGQDAVWQVKVTAICAIALMALVHYVYARANYYSQATT